MNSDYIAKKMNLSLLELKDEITRVAKFYDMEDLNIEEQLFLFVLAKVRDLNSDEFNMYKTNAQAKIIYGANETKELIYDNNFYENLFSYLDSINLNYQAK